MARPTTPRSLGTKAQKFWRDVTGEYDLRADELLVLEDACREIDLVEQLEAAQREETFVAAGYNGQPVAAPLLGEIRQHRALFAQLLRQLKLPDSDSGTAGARPSTSDLARKAANARWQRGA